MRQSPDGAVVGTVGHQTERSDWNGRPGNEPALGTVEQAVEVQPEARRARRKEGCRMSERSEFGRPRLDRAP